MKTKQSLIKAFYPSIKIIVWFLSLNLCVTTFTDFHRSNKFLHVWNEPNLVMVCDLLNMFLNLICKYFIENFLFMILKGIHLVFLVLCPYVIMSIFGYMGLELYWIQSLREAKSKLLEHRLLKYPPMIIWMLWKPALIPLFCLWFY